VRAQTLPCEPLFREEAHAFRGAEIFILINLIEGRSSQELQHARPKTINRNSGPAMRKLSLAKVYQLLEPGPVVLLTSARNGRANVMAMSWHMMVEFERPLVACVVSSANHSFAALRASGECVIAIPARRLASAVVKIGNSSGRDIDKFAALGLTALPAKQVGAPLVAECFANLECRVVDTSWVKKYDLFLLEVLQAWRDPAQRNPKTIHHHGYGTFVVDGRTIKLKSRMR